LRYIGKMRSAINREYEAWDDAARSFLMLAYVGLGKVLDEAMVKKFTALKDKYK
jgi:hypothetical protein